MAEYLTEVERKRLGILLAQHGATNLARRVDKPRYWVRRRVKRWAKGHRARVSVSDADSLVWAAGYGLHVRYWRHPLEGQSMAFLVALRKWGADWRLSPEDAAELIVEPDVLALRQLGLIVNTDSGLRAAA